MNNQDKSGRALDLLRRHCNTYATPVWRSELALRQKRAFKPLPHNREMMRRLCVAIAYSQGARSAQIGKLIATNVFKAAFADFNPVALAMCKPADILRKYWSRLSHFRFQGKIVQIVRCAQVLNDIARHHGSFAAYLKSFQIPRRISSEADIEKFWRQFDALQSDLRRRQMPFFRATTSLLQLLLDLDYDSVKPDLIVMRLARRLDIVQRETGDCAFRQCVRYLQAYAVKRGCRAAEIDWVLLAFGGQTGAKQSLAKEEFCPAKDPCTHSSCPIGKNHLCLAYQLAAR